MSAYKKLLFFLLLNIVIGTQVQCSNNLQKKWEHWEQHPIYSFFQIVADSTSSMPDIMTLKTKGYMKGILGKSYPVFHLDKDSLTIDVRMKYKTKNLEVRWCDDFKERMMRAIEMQPDFYDNNGNYIGEYDESCMEKIFV